MNLSKGEITLPSIFISVLPDRGGEVLGLVHVCEVLLFHLPGFWVCSAFKFWHPGLQIDLNFIILNESTLCPGGQGSQRLLGLYQTESG